MKYSIGVVLLALGLSYGHGSDLQAQDIPHYTSVPHFYDFLPNAATDWLPALKNADPRDHVEAYAGILSLSAILIYYDQDILIGSQKYATRLHLISDKDKGADSRVFFHEVVGGVSADFRVPRGTNATMYYIGDGLTSLSIVAGLSIFGTVTDDKRALNTASQFMESLVLTGSFVLPSKYISGRESPVKATKEGGAWRPVPGVKSYLSNVSKHDAFPSGHIATAMSGVTILHENYPEKTWLLPVGYSAMSLLMFAMVNNGVHWAGDYPVGIAIGYVAATTVFERRKPLDYETPGGKDVAKEKQYNFLPFFDARGLGLMFDLKS